MNTSETRCRDLLNAPRNPRKHAAVAGPSGTSRKDPREYVAGLMGLKKENCENLLQGKHLHISNPPEGLCGDTLSVLKKGMAKVDMNLLFFVRFASMVLSINKK